MKNVRKVLALAVVVIMAAALAACGTSSPAGGGVNPITNGGSSSTEVEKYVRDYGDIFMESFEEGFESSGLSCTSSISASGNTIILDVRLEDIDGLTDSVKREMQSALQDMEPTMTSAFEVFKAEIPSLTRVTVNYRESDGDLIGSVVCDL